MDIGDFVKLRASEAAKLYRAHRDAGEPAEASRLHQAYFEAHRVKLSDDRHIAEAAAPAPPNAWAARTEIVRMDGRSKVRLVGALLSGAGLAIGLFATAAGIGAAGLVIAGGMTSTGFALWSVGILEDRLIEIRRAIQR